MARERMVTRTINFTEVKILAIELEGRKVFETSVNLSGDCTDVKAVKLVEQIDSILSERDGPIKCVNILDMKICEHLYGMPETEFIRLATILPPR